MKLEDLKGMKIPPEWSELDVLAEVAALATELFDQESASNTHGFKEERVMRLWKPIPYPTCKKKRSPRRRCFKKIESSAYPFDIFQEDGSIRETFKDPGMEEEDDRKSSDVEYCSKSKRKRCRKSKTSGEEVIKKRRKTTIMQRGPEPPPDMPIGFKNFIREMGGSDAILVIQKPLYWTDTNPGHNRLSVPLTQVRASFLRDEEEMELNAQGGIEVDLIEPSLHISTLTLKKWKMKSTCSIYALLTNWNLVVKNNNLDQGVIVQLWSFRVRAKLCFALVRVGMGGDEGGSSSRSNGDGASTSQAQDHDMATTTSNTQTGQDQD